MEIRLHNLFQFIFCVVILISRPESWVWQINLVVFSKKNPNFISLILCCLKIELHNLFWFTFNKLSKSNDPGCQFSRLTRVDSGLFSSLLSMRLSKPCGFDELTRVDCVFWCLFCIEFFFWILSFNIKLIGK